MSGMEVFQIYTEAKYVPGTFSYNPSKPPSIHPPAHQTNLVTKSDQPAVEILFSNSMEKKSAYPVL